jgi:hypothetical protein
MSTSLASLTVDAALRACPVVMVGSDMLAELLPVMPRNSRNKAEELSEAALFIESRFGRRNQYVITAQ